MKKLYMFCFVVCLCQTAGAQDWKWMNPLPPGYQLSSVYFTDANTGYAVGERGTIIKTTDGCATMTSQQSGTSVLLYAVCFEDPNHGCAVGEEGTIVRTNDGGAN